MNKKINIRIKNKKKMGNSHHKKTKISYYKLLNKSLKKNQDKNYYSIDNINYSFLTKSFSNSHKLDINFDFQGKKITWENYLKRKLLYLSSNYNYLWAKNLFIFITRNKFPNQYKYYSLFFYEEFQITSLPKIINYHPISHYSYNYSDIITTNKEDKNIYEINSDSNDDEFIDSDNKSTNINNKYGYKGIIDNIYSKNKIIFSPQLLGSLASVNTEEFNYYSNDNNPTLQYKLGKSKLKKYINIFKIHLCHKDHPINIILNKFSLEFNPYITEIIMSCKNILNDKKNYQKCQDIINQLQEFIITLEITVKLFYSKCISYDAFKDEKDEFLNLINFVVFNTGNIYKNIFEILQIMNYDKIQQFENQIQKFGEKRPEELGVEIKFCLNEITTEYMNKYKNRKKTINNNNDSEDNGNISNIDELNIKNKDNSEINTKKENLLKFTNSFNNFNRSMPQNISIDNSNDSIFKDNIVKKNETNKIDINIMDILNINNEKSNIFSQISFNSENKKNEPYYEAIEALKKIIKCKTPLEKLVLIASMSSFINDSIYKFWKPIENSINPSVLNIEADELMKIFVYIVYKSKMSKLFVHLDFIKYFTIKETKSTMIGYYCTLLEGAINYILEVKDFLNK